MNPIGAVLDGNVTAQEIIPYTILPDDMEANQQRQEERSRQRHTDDTVAFRRLRPSVYVSYLREALNLNGDAVDMNVLNVPMLSCQSLIHAMYEDRHEQISLRNEKYAEPLYIKIQRK